MNVAMRVVLTFFLVLFFSFSSFSQRYTNYSTSEYKGMSTSDMMTLAKIAKERRCNNYILEIKKNGSLIETYRNYSSTAISNIKFYEAISALDESKLYFAIVQFKTKSGFDSKEYVYTVNRFTEKQYKKNYMVSAGTAFYNYIYKYNTDKECSYNGFK